MTKQYYLLKFSRDWADEFQAEGLAVVTNTDIELIESVIYDENVRDEYVWFYFGTNEGWEDEFTYLELWEKEIKKVEISAQEAEFLSANVLGRGTTFGQFPDFDYLFENLEGVEAVDKYYEALEARIV